jgi:thioredoxin reductase
MNEYDVVVIGGGAAGLSAALVLSRARRTVLVVDAGTPRNAPAAHMHGFLSRDGMPPQLLLAVGREEVTRYGGEIRTGAAARLARRDEHTFEIRLSDGTEVGARRVVVATGLRDEIPDIPGARERWGIDLLHCPYCHGYEVRDQPLGVLGGTPDAIQHAHLVRQWSADVIYFPHTDELAALQREQLNARGIRVVEGLVTRLAIESDRLAGVAVQDGTVIARSAVFVRPRLIANAKLLVGLGCATTEQGWVATDATGQTSVPGVWVAGNASNPRAQVITAAGEGSTAAIALNADLIEEDIRRAAPAVATTATG